MQQRKWGEGMRLVALMLGAAVLAAGCTSRMDTERASERRRYLEQILPATGPEGLTVAERRVVAYNGRGWVDVSGLGDGGDDEGLQDLTDEQEALVDKVRPHGDLDGYAFVAYRASDADESADPAAVVQAYLSSYPVGYLPVKAEPEPTREPDEGADDEAPQPEELDASEAESANTQAEQAQPSEEATGEHAEPEAGAHVEDGCEHGEGAAKEEAACACKPVDAAAAQPPGGDRAQGVVELCACPPDEEGQGPMYCVRARGLRVEVTAAPGAHEQAEAVARDVHRRVTEAVRARAKLRREMQALREDLPPGAIPLTGVWGHLGRHINMEEAQYDVLRKQW